MIDKQIIIDGVDVAKCRCFTSEWDFNNCRHICKGTECKYKRLWYKKQLKRKEQKCEELKEALNEGCLQYLTLMTEQRVLLKILTEIKEIAEWHTTSADSEDVQEDMKQILQKIGECEVDND